MLKTKPHHSITMEKLPNPDQAFIDLNKLTGYCLNAEHPEGQHKALIFKSALNIEINYPAASGRGITG